MEPRMSANERQIRVASRGFAVQNIFLSPRMDANERQIRVASRLSRRSVAGWIRGSIFTNA
jgi:hypothetical protein